MYIHGETGVRRKVGVMRSYRVDRLWRLGIPSFWAAFFGLNSVLTSDSSEVFYRKGRPGEASTAWMCRGMIS
jgi:hypothetical protein